MLATISSRTTWRSLIFIGQCKRSLQTRNLDKERAQALLQQGKTICLITCSIHASEVGAAQMSMELAYDMATRHDRDALQILENVILLLLPSLNPDGLDLVVKW